MHYVYILRSIAHPDRYYVGATEDLEQRVKTHNAGSSTHTNRFKPWKLYWYAAFQHSEKAQAFEAYLKSGSGRRFQKRHLGIDPTPDE